MKIGFHCGEGGNHTGLSEYLSRLDQNGLPFYIKGVDSMAGVYDAQLIAQNSQVPHVIVFRLSGVNYDTPNYDLPAQQAAEEHWILHKTSWPINLDVGNVWIETINEVDKNRANWLGEFAYYTALLALQDNIKWAAFGWSTGEPEPEHWKLPAMSVFLALAANHPNRLAVALHEYSLDTNNINNGDGYLIGRFKHLNTACQEMGIDPPTTFITEWGWQHNNVPSVDPAMQDVESIAVMYDGYDNVKGAMLWYLGGGYSNIADKAQQLIEPVTNLALNWYSPSCERPYDVIYVLSPQQLTQNELQQLTMWCFNGFVLPDGQVTTGKHTWTYSHDDAFTSVGQGQSGSLLVIVAGHRIGTGIDEDWVAQNHPSLIGQCVFLDFPNEQESVKIGLHASADPGDLTETEFQEFANLQPTVIKVLSAHSRYSIEQLSIYHQNATFIIRAFLDFGQRVITPHQFVTDTITDIERALTASHGKDVWVEIHNEPNLAQEGLYTSWQNGSEFASWFATVLQLYRDQIDYPVKFLYPGLSPGPSSSGKIGHVEFLNDSTSAIHLADGLGVHAYWSQHYPMSEAISHVREHQSFGKPLWVTECSRNDRPAVISDDEYAQEYVQFYESLRTVSSAMGVTFFVASASNQTFWPESWIVNGESKGIGSRIRQLLNGSK